MIEKLTKLLSKKDLEGFDLSGNMVEHKNHNIYIMPTANGGFNLTIATPKDFGESFDNAKDAKEYSNAINKAITIFECLINNKND
jgi:hypothetical protein